MRRESRKAGLVSGSFERERSRTGIELNDILLRIFLVSDQIVLARSVKHGRGLLM